VAVACQLAFQVPLLNSPCGALLSTDATVLLPYLQITYENIVNQQLQI